MPQQMGTRMGTQPPANAQKFKDLLRKVNAGLTLTHGSEGEAA